MSNSKENKLLCIVGPTASGKSSLAVELARKHDGEIISADSRQVYRGLDIATGKIPEDERLGIPHHLLDVADFRDQFSVAEFKELADEAIDEIHGKGKLPILVGGTGFYIQAVVDNLLLPEVPPNKELRRKLQKLPVNELFEKLKKLDPRRARTVDKENPRRLIRAIEIAEELGEVPRLKKNQRFNTFQIGLSLPEDDLLDRITLRTQERLAEGMIEETKKLHDDGLSIERMRELGLEYTHLADYLEEKINRKELEERVIQDDRRYAKRQMRWFKRDKRIQWFDPREREKIELEVAKWIMS